MLILFTVIITADRAKMIKCVKRVNWNLEIVWNNLECHKGLCKPKAPDMGLQTKQYICHYHYFTNDIKQAISGRVQNVSIEFEDSLLLIILSWKFSCSSYQSSLILLLIFQISECICKVWNVVFSYSDLWIHTPRVPYMLHIWFAV